MSARLTLEFFDDGTMTYEHGVSKGSNERAVESFGTMSYLDVRHLPVAAGADMAHTHHVMIMTVETFEEIRRRLDSDPPASSLVYLEVVGCWMSSPSTPSGLTSERRRAIEDWRDGIHSRTDTRCYDGCDCGGAYTREAFDDLLTEIDRLTAELHAGHTLVPQSLYTAPNVRPGWMACIRCQYETPSCGYCTVHNTLDKCWASPPPPPVVAPKPCEGANHRWLCPGGVLPIVGDPCQCGQSVWTWTWPEPPLLPPKES